MNQEINVVVYKEDELFHAQCLEYDIMASSERLDHLEEEFRRALLIDMHVSKQRYGKVFANINPAPEMFFEMWDEVATEHHAKSIWRSIWRLIKNLFTGRKKWDVPFLETYVSVNALTFPA